jgi:hypothetical protein
MTVEERAQTITKVLGGTDGFWKSSTEEAVFESARQLLENGWESEEVEQYLSYIMSSMREEYGD